MALSTFAKNALLSTGSFDSIALYASLHSADPGTTGASELSGGSPAYARIAVTWDPASGGVMAADTGTPVIFDVESGDTVAYGGLWDASSGGNFIIGDAVTNHTFGAQGTYELTAITATAT